MSESDYQQLVERVLHSVSNPMISTDTGIEAVRQISTVAEQEEIVWAVVGGLAMWHACEVAAR